VESSEANGWKRAIAEPDDVDRLDFEAREPPVSRRRLMADPARATALEHGGMQTELLGERDPAETEQVGREPLQRAPADAVANGRGSEAQRPELWSRDQAALCRCNGANLLVDLHPASL
jgi:hypothetical protein